MLEHSNFGTLIFGTFDLGSKIKMQKTGFEKWSLQRTVTFGNSGTYFKNVVSHLLDLIEVFQMMKH